MGLEWFFLVSGFDLTSEWNLIFWVVGCVSSICKWVLCFGLLWVFVLFLQGVGLVQSSISVEKRSMG